MTDAPAWIEAAVEHATATFARWHLDPEPGARLRAWEIVQYDPAVRATIAAFLRKRAALAVEHGESGALPVEWMMEAADAVERGGKSDD